MMRPGASALALLLALFTGCSEGASHYFGKEIGPLSELHHGVRGRVYAIDSRTLYLHDFHYDGEGPTAYFYVGTSKSPGPAGALRLRDERGGAGPLRRYRGAGLTLALPDGKTLRDVKWFSIWCDEYAVNFGDVSIPRELDYPKSVKVSGLRGIHGVSSDPVIVVDAQTLLVPNFSYDGEAPDAKFWVGRSDKPSPQGIRIPDEHGKEMPLRKYDRKTIVLTLPGELTVFDIGHLAVWCEAFTVDFGHVTLPRAQLSNIPPSLKMLGVSPQNRNKELVKEPASTPPARSHRPSSRRPIARLDATTYRPQLRPGTGPLAAILDPSPHTSLHRRADNYSPAAAQLINQDDKDQSQKHQDQKQAHDSQSQKYQEQKTSSEVDQSQDQQITAQHQYQPSIESEQTQSVPQNHLSSIEQKHLTQTVARNQNHQQSSLEQNQQSAAQNQQIEPQVKNEYYQQEKSQEIYQEHYQEQEPFYQPQQYHNPYYQTPVYQNFYQPQAFDQRAYEQRAFELLNHRQYQPLQYRLVPYNAGRY